MDTEPVVIETPEEEIRHIDIIISNEDNETVFKVGGTVSRKTAHKFMESVGYAFIPHEPITPNLAMPGRPIAIGKISCEHNRDCTVYPDECSKCGNNKAKSYFTPKEESTIGPHTSVTVSILPDTSGDYVIMGENSEAVLKAVGEYLLATKSEEEA